MAWIDKIYGSQEQYDELHGWLTVNKPELIKRLYPQQSDETRVRPISNFSLDDDEYLMERCPLEWVVKAIKIQYGLLSDDL